MGLAVVENLVAKGWHVSIFDFDDAAGAKVSQRLGEQLLFIQGNVVNYDEQVAAFSKTWEKWGHVDFGKLSILAGKQVADSFCSVCQCCT